MTVRIAVLNSGPRPVVAKVVGRENGLPPNLTPPTEIPAGGFVEHLYVHSGQSILVEEVLPEGEPA
jgi:hypothetical protein